MRRVSTMIGSAAMVATAGLLFAGMQTENLETYTRVPFPESPKPALNRATILFGGDMMFDRSVRVAMEDRSVDHVFSCIRDLLTGVDLVVANLEGSITPFASKSVGTVSGGVGNTIFTFATSTADLLFRHNIRLVNLGNNHIMDFSREGLFETKKWLDSASVAYFGDPDLPEADRVERISIHSIPFSFVNWSDWTSDKTDHTVAQIGKEAEAGRVVVVYTHWGEEYVPPPERVKQLARSFVDAGAEIVIGSHPHIVQEAEFYDGKHIYYSLGNFVFDQYWEEAVRRGLLLRVTFTPTGVSSVEELPIDNQADRQTCPA